MQNAELKHAMGKIQTRNGVSEASAIAVSEPLFPRLFLIITATAFGVVFPFFFLGILAGHDFVFHLSSWMEVLGQWKQGIIYPRWAALANYGYGEARFIFYPPASWILGAALGMVLPWKLVAGAYVLLVLTLSGCSMFALARRWLGTRDAIFAAALYAANPYYFVIVYWRSDFSELLAGALLPLLLLFVLRIDEEGTTPAVSLGLIVAAAWLTNAPVAVMASYSAVLLLVTMAVIRRSPRVLLGGAAALLLGASLAAFYILPAAYEQAWVNISQVLAQGLSPQDNFLFASIGDAGHDAFNRLLSMVGVSEIITLTLAFGFARRWWHTQRDAFWTLLVWAAAAALLMFSATSAFWGYLPMLRFLQFPWRWLLCLNVVFALLVTMAWRSKLARAVVCVGMLAILIFGAWRIQRPWKTTGDDIARMRDHQRDGHGYKSRPEYVPAGAGVAAIKENSEPVTIEGGGLGRIQVQRWDAESKVFTANVTGPETLVLRLFNYPAWSVEVNGRVVKSETQVATGQMMITVPPGENLIWIAFVRTWDRTVGGIISIVAIVVVVVCGTAALKPHRTRPVLS